MEFNSGFKGLIINSRFLLRRPGICPFILYWTAPNNWQKI